MTWLGLDIGGANLKAANAAGWASSLPFALWRDPNGLSGALAALVARAPAADRLAVTMTGELCDCFPSKAEGVRHILAAVKETADGRDSSVYLTDGRFVALAAAHESPQLAAASNWRALAQFACRFVPVGSGLLIDVGSTTSDIIPIVDGRVAARGRSDTERLATRELVYSGVGRTPICAVMDALPLGCVMCPLAAEVFSTTADAYLLLGELAEDSLANWTADGRPLTIECARQRLARQLCGDAADLKSDDLVRIAGAVYDAQWRQLANGLESVAGEMGQRPDMAILSGFGEFLARRAVASSIRNCQIISLAERFGSEISRSAPAFALAVLAEEAIGQ